MKKIITILLLCASLVSLAQNQKANKFEPGQMRRDAMMSYVNASWFDCVISCQRLQAMGYNDGVVSGILAYAYDSLQNQIAREKAMHQAAEFAFSSMKTGSNNRPQIADTMWDKHVVLAKANDYYNAAKYDSSAMAYTDYLKRNPTDTFAMYYLGNAHFFQKNYKDAITAYKRILDIDFKRANVQNLIGVCYMAQNNYLDARDFFAQSSLLDKEMGVSYFNLGKVHRGLQDNVSAEACLRKANTLMPADKDVLNMLTEMYWDKKDYENSETYLKKLFALDRKNEKVAWNLITCALNQNNLERAQAYTLSAIHINPKNPQGYIKLGDIYLAQNMQLEAMQNYEDAIVKCGETKDLLVKASESANNLKLYGRSVELLSRAVAIDGTDAKAYYNLGQAYAGLKNKKQAKSNFKMAENLAPDTYGKKKGS